MEYLCDLQQMLAFTFLIHTHYDIGIKMEASNLTQEMQKYTMQIMTLAANINGLKESRFLEIGQVNKRSDSALSRLHGNTH